MRGEFLVIVEFVRKDVGFWVFKSVKWGELGEWEFCWYWWDSGLNL